MADEWMLGLLSTQVLEHLQCAVHHLVAQARYWMVTRQALGHVALLHRLLFYGTPDIFPHLPSAPQASLLRYNFYALNNDISLLRDRIQSYITPYLTIGGRLEKIGLDQSKIELGFCCLFSICYPLPPSSISYFLSSRRAA